MNSTLICPTHKKQISAVYLEKEAKTKLVCFKCIKEAALNFSDCILIEDILDFNVNEILLSPAISYYFSKSRLERFTSVWKSEDLVKELEISFTKLIDEVVVAINQVKDELISSLKDTTAKKAIKEEIVSLFGLEKVAKSINEGKLEEVEKTLNEAPFVKETKAIAAKADECFNTFNAELKIGKILTDFDRTKERTIAQIKDNFDVSLQFTNSFFTFNEKCLNLDPRCFNQLTTTWNSSNCILTATMGEPIKPNTGTYTVSLRFSEINEQHPISLGLLKFENLNLGKTPDWKLPTVKFSTDKQFFNGRCYGTKQFNYNSYYQESNVKYLTDYVFTMTFNSDKRTLKIKDKNKQLIYKVKDIKAAYYQFFVSANHATVKII